MAGNRVIIPFLVIIWQTSSLTALNPGKRQFLLGVSLGPAPNGRKAGAGPGIISIPASKWEGET